MIIIEGPDGSGKTTLVGKISKQFPQLVMDHRLDRDDKREEAHRVNTVRARTYTALARAVQGGRPNMYDRLFYSEIVYGNLLRGGSRFSDEECWYINRVLEALQPPVVLCLPPLEVVKNNVLKSQDKQMHGVLDNIGSIYATYTGIVGQARSIIVYDYTKHDPELSVIPVIAAYLEQRRVREW